MKGILNTLGLMIITMIIGVVGGFIGVIVIMIDLEVSSPGTVDKLLFTSIRQRTGKRKEENPEDKVFRGPVGFKTT